MANTQTARKVDPDLQSFATAVLAAVRNVGSRSTERFGAKKVFISAVYVGFTGGRSLTDVAALNAFKLRLIAAQSAGLLVLARADLVGAMPKAAVASSEVSDRCATYHFVLDASAREPWEVGS